VALLVEGVEEGDGLDGLAEAHLVGEDDVGVVGPGVARPGDSLQLVGMEGQALGQPLACRVILAENLLQLQLQLHFSSVGDPEPEPHVLGPPGSGSISQRYGSGSGSFYHQATIVRKTLIPTIL
jgi:hypothetical protein